MLLVSAPVLAADRLIEQEGGKDDDGGEEGGGPKRADIGAVFQEMSGVLVPRVINKNATGDQFRCAAKSLKKSVETQNTCLLVVVCARRTNRVKSGDAIVCVWLCVGVGGCFCFVRLFGQGTCLIFTTHTGVFRAI